MVWLDACIDDHRALAAPMFVLNGRLHAMDVVGGVGPGEGNPQEIIQVLTGESTVVYQSDKREGRFYRAEGRMIGQGQGQRLGHLLAVITVGGSLNGEDSG